MEKLIKNSNKLNTTLFVAIIFIVFIAMFILNYKAPLFNDDLDYSYSFANGKKIESVSEIPASMQKHYNTLNARIYTHSLAQLFLLLGKNIFNVINSIAFVILGILIYYHIIGSLKNKRPEILSIIYASLFLLAPAFGQSFIWLVGSANYLYGILTILICLIPFRKYNKEKYKTNILKEILLTFIMLFAGIICVNSNENNIVDFICIVISYIIYVFINEKKAIPWMISTLIGALTGLILILISPGQLSRLDEAGGITVLNMIINFIKHTIKMFSNFHILFIFIILMLVSIINNIGIISAIKKINIKNIFEFIKKHFIIITYLIAFLASVYSMIVVPYFPPRAWSGPLVFITILTGLLYMHVESKKLYSIKKYTFSIAVLLFFIASCTYCGDALSAIKNDNIKINRRIELINIAKNNDMDEVEVPSIFTTSKYSIIANNDYLSYDSAEWPNSTIAKYYGLEKVIRNDNVK